MPAFTVNRLYPYSLATDPADVPVALQSLAEAIDADVCALTAGVTGRPVAQFRGTGPYSSFVTSVPGFPRSLPFDSEEFDTANVTMQSQEPVNRLIFPEEPGFYFAVATVQVPALTVSGSVAVMADINIAKGDITSPATPRIRLAGASHNLAVGPDDRNIRNFTCSTGMFMNGTTDAFCVTFFADTTPDVTEYVIAERTLTLLRMTMS